MKNFTLVRYVDEQQTKRCCSTAVTSLFQVNPRQGEKCAVVDAETESYYPKKEAIIKEEDVAT